MNIFTLFTVVEDIDRLTDTEWDTIVKREQEKYPIRHRLSLCGESLLEQGLKIQQNMSPESALYACTIAPKIGNELELIAEKIKALKYTTTVIKYPYLQLFEQQDTLKIWLDYLSNKPTEQALYILEHEDEVKGKSWLPAYFSQALNIPLVSNVNTILQVTKNNVRLSVNKENGLDIVEACLPLVISIGSSDITKLRMPTMKEKIQTKNTKIEYISIEKSLLPAENAHLVSMCRAGIAQRHCQKQTDTHVQQAAQTFLKTLKENLA